MPEAKEVVKKADRKLQRPPISNNKDTILAATLNPVLVDHGTQCDYPAALLNAEQLKLAEEQLQREVYLAKKAFFLPDQDSDSDSDGAWDSMSDTEVQYAKQHLSLELTLAFKVVDFCPT